MIALIDCNNFFVSCELTVHPELCGRPVIVGGNGDNGGCAIAMSNEAKAAGVQRGMPIFKIRKLIEQHSIAVLPANHKLYSRISANVMSTLRRFQLPLEVYSVDEAFLHLIFQGEAAVEFCQYVRQKISEETGIPVSIGIAPNKTLAKIATAFAKHYKGYNGVCLMDTDTKIRRGLELTPIGDVWGIGRKLRLKLTAVGIATAAQFADIALDTIERNYSAPVAAIWHELNGRYIFDEASHQHKYKSCTCSRTFQHDITDREEVARMIAKFTASVARSLRKHGRLATEIEVRIATNPYRTDRAQRNVAERIKLEQPTADTMTLTAVAIKLFHSIFRLGYGYKKAGVTATATIDAVGFSHGLFDDTKREEKSQKLMQTIDRLQDSGLDIHLAATS